jgi:hypothetical protein
MLSAMQTQGAPAEQIEGPPHALGGHVPPHAADADAEARRNPWIDHAARTTAVLAVLAAVSSGQYAGQFSQTILAQAEASDAWSYYQAKSIKKHLSEGQIDIARAMAQGRPELVPALAALEQKHGAAAQKYDKELLDARQSAERIERNKTRHQKMGDRFQYAFVVLQAGVVLSTIAASARRRELWVAAVLCGVGGLLMVGNGFLLLV